MPNGQNGQVRDTRENSQGQKPLAGQGQEPPAPLGEALQNYGALKGYFYTPKRGDIWGAFCFLFNGATGESMDNVFWVTRMLSGNPIDVTMGWRGLNKVIPSMGVYEKPLGEKLVNSLIESFSATARVELGKNTDAAPNLDAVGESIRNGFERVTHCFLELKLAYERLSRQDMVNAGLAPGEGQSENSEITKVTMEEGGEKSFAGTLINCLPVIDPVYGKPVSELKLGDMLEVRIQAGAGASELVQKFLDSTDQPAVFPVCAIEKKDDEKTYVLLEINEEVKGVISVTRDLRLRALGGGSKKAVITINVDNLVLFGICFAAFIVIVIIIRYLFF
ncbi:MAG: hypothetical protein LBC93_06145 [Synergistaceae bacterium]|jgi:hypothetical protein|nr:hypothetical protein [Synergistaceae bacterium]